MADRTLNVALRIRADLDEAASDVQRLDDAVESLGDTGKEASAGLNALAGAADKAATATRAEATAANTAASAQRERAQATRTATTATDASTTAHRQHAAAVKVDAAAVGSMEQKAARAGISVGQYSMAMRMLPAQMTDIGVGLATGQSPFMVMLQQGGQLKDMFGGIAPAARAVGGAVMGMVNPFTIAAAVVGGLGVALVRHQNELAAYDQALITTGGYAGRLASQLQAAADDMQDVGHGDAVEGLTAVAASGRFAGEAFDLVSESAARMKASVGKDVADTIAAFVAIQDDPVKALLKLNETEHFLTQTQLDRVQALIAEGREQDAVAEATRIYSDHLNDVADAAEAARAPLDRLWTDAKRGASAAAAEVGRFANFLAQAAIQAREANASEPWYMKGLATISPLYRGVRGYQALSTATPDEPAAAPTSASQAVDSRKVAQEAEAQKKREREREAFFASEVRYLDDSAKKKREIQSVNDMVTAGTISQAEATQRVALIEADYAEKGKKRGAQKRTDAQQAEESAQREVANLQKQAAMLDVIEGDQKRASEEARMRYETEQGAYKAASAAAKAALIDGAKLLDQKRAEREAEEAKRQEIEKTKRAYEQLQDTLRTPTEVAVETAIERIKTLNDAMSRGIGEASKYDAQVSRIIDAAFTKPPTFNGLSPEIGGISSEQYRLDQQKAALETWYTDQLSRLEKFRQDQQYVNIDWNARDEQIQAAHAQALGALNQAQNQLMLQQGASAFDSMAQVAKAYGGEQSRTYRVLFAISKGFAVAQAAVALAQNVAEASKAGFPQNIGYIAGAIAQGATIASLLSAAQYATGGRIVGPGTGTSDSVPIMASAGEYMVRYASANQPGAHAFLEDFNARGMAAVRDWRGYADGGSITAGAEPLGRYSDGGTRGNPVNNSLRLYNYFDLDTMMQAIANHPLLEKAVVNYASQNGQAIKAEWQ